MITLFFNDDNDKQLEGPLISKQLLFSHRYKRLNVHWKSSTHQQIKSRIQKQWG